MSSIRDRGVIFLFATLIGGCAADEFKRSPGYDGFLDLIAQKCYPDTIGQYLVRDLASGNLSAGFLDATSSLYYGKMDPTAYRQFVTGFSDNGVETNKAIDCILKYLPVDRPRYPGGRPVEVTPNYVPPPPPQ